MVRLELIRLLCNKVGKLSPVIPAARTSPLKLSRDSLLARTGKYSQGKSPENPWSNYPKTEVRYRFDIE